MSGRYEQDFLDRARSVAASVMFAAGLAAIVGSLLDWVTIDPPPRLPPDQNADSFTGIEAGDGWWVVLGALSIIAGATLLVLRPRPLYGWLAFLGSTLIGAIAIADYRDVDELTERMDRVGRDIDPALGLSLVAAAALVGLIASVAGVAASPRRD
jgi:energy-converting hydrogenase Eha subunit C